MSEVLSSDDMYLAMCDTESLTTVMSKGDQQTILLYFQNTQKEFIKKRKGRGGREYSYVEGWYIKQVLNLATKFQWSSFIDNTLRDGDFIIVWGRVEITIAGQKYTQSDFGRNEIKYLSCDKIKSIKDACAKGDKAICKKHTCEQPVDIGDAYKSARTDMIKRCANSWGIAMDVYSGRDTE